MWEDCAGLNVAADKTSKLSKSPKIQSLIDEIINDGSTEHHTTPPEKTPSVIVVEVFREKLLPKAPPSVADDALQENIIPSTPPPELVAAVFQEGPLFQVDESPDDFLATVIESEELVDVYLLEEFLDKELIRNKIDEVRRKLEGSAILIFKEHRLKVLLGAITQNRYRVQIIFK